MGALLHGEGGLASARRGGRRVEATSALPESLKPLRIQGRVADRILNVAVTQVVLNEPQVTTPVAEVVPAGVAQLVCIGSHGKRCALTGLGDDSPEAVARHRAPASLPLSTPPTVEHPCEPGELVGFHRMDAGFRAFLAAAMNRSSDEINVAHAQRHELGGAKAMPIGEQDHGEVSRAIALARLRCAKEGADFVRSEIVAQPCRLLPCPQRTGSRCVFNPIALFRARPSEAAGEIGPAPPTHQNEGDACYPIREGRIGVLAGRVVATVSKGSVNARDRARDAPPIHLSPAGASPGRMSPVSRRRRVPS